ncbi:MAG: DUF1194 domain-containing protein [Pseudomonadota bacterium]
MKWLTLALSVLAGGAAAQCRQALALGLDVSGSVDAREYRLQVEGVATALGSEPVRAALFAMPGADVALMVYEWSGPEDTHVLLPWTDIDGPAVLDSAIETLRGVERRASTPGTGLGQAMLDGAAFLAERSDCARLVLDISGDGKSNLGPRPGDVKDTLARTGITLNALVIGADAPSIGDARQTEIGELSSYFNANVIVGRDAFVQTALGFDAYAEAMQRKLERELQVLILSHVKNPR